MCYEMTVDPPHINAFSNDAYEFNVVLRYIAPPSCGRFGCVSYWWFCSETRYVERIDHGDTMELRESLFSEVWRDEFQWGTSRPMTRARHGAAARFVGSLGKSLQVS